MLTEFVHGAGSPERNGNDREAFKKENEDTRRIFGKTDYQPTNLEYHSYDERLLIECTLCSARPSAIPDCEKRNRPINLR